MPLLRMQFYSLYIDSKLFRGLIQTVLSTASDNTKEEALKYYDDVVDLIDRKAQVQTTWNILCGN